jgi:hypothetical protein
MEEHRTSVRTTRILDYRLGLPRRHAGSLGWALGPSEKGPDRSKVPGQGNPDMSRGPVQARVQALPCAPRSGGDPLLPRGLWPVT